jgi:hypothetical protein
MNNKLFISLALACCVQIVHSQIKYEAIVIEKSGGFKSGDTVSVIGYKAPAGELPAQYYLKKGSDYKSVPFAKIKMVSQPVDFWEQTWFYNRSAEIISGGWDTKIRNELRADANDFVSNLSRNQLIFKDDLLEDYLYQLVHQIMPGKLNKEISCSFSIVLMKANEPNVFSFDNGTIVLTTGLLSEFHSEKDLTACLAGEIAKIVLDFNVLNVRQQIRNQRSAAFWSGFSVLASSAFMGYSNVRYHSSFSPDDVLLLSAASSIVGSSVLESMGAKYTSDQELKMQSISDNYMRTCYDRWNHKSSGEFIGITANVISFMAWQQFYKEDYKSSLELVNRLESSGIPSEEDYLLKSKIYRILYHTDEANYEALECIKKAKALGVNKLIELEKEEGLIYLRIGDKEKAKQAFNRYMQGLEEMHGQGENDPDEIQWVKNIMYKNGLY